MKRKLMVIMLTLLLVLSLGCIGTTPSHTKTSSYSSITTSTSTSQKSSTTTSQAQKEDFPKTLSSIERFTYTSYGNVSMNISVEVGNSEQNSTVLLITQESGYIDLVEREAVINSSTLSLPDNVSVKTEKVVKDGKTYIKLFLGEERSVTNVTNESSDFLSEYNAVSLAKKYISKIPEEKKRDGSKLELTYILGWEDAKALATIYIGPSEDAGIEVKRGRITLVFEGNTLKEVIVNYSVVFKTTMNDPLLGPMDVRIKANGSIRTEITSINKKINVKPLT
jgi:hypothetical protein